MTNSLLLFMGKLIGKNRTSLKKIKMVLRL